MFGNRNVWRNNNLFIEPRSHFAKNGAQQLTNTCKIHAQSSVRNWTLNTLRQFEFKVSADGFH